MSDQADHFTTIERTIVDWLEASGHAVVHDDCEWLVLGPKWPLVKEHEISITALACAIHQALEKLK